jgi:hypothetical protein
MSMSAKLKHDFPMVLVNWLDASGGHDQGWRGLRDVKSAKPSRGRSLGFLVATGELDGIEFLVVCPHMVGTKNIEGDGEIAIPKSWVLDIKFLEPKDEK